MLALHSTGSKPVADETESLLEAGCRRAGSGSREGAGREDFADWLDFADFEADNSPERRGLIPE